MAEAISLPPGAFAAAKSGAPQPAPAAPKPEATPKPKEAAKAPEIVRRPAPEAKPDPVPPKPAAEAAPAGETAAEKRIRKLKVAGQEREWDLSNEEETLRAIAKGLGADEVFRKTARDREEFENALKIIQGGGDPKKIDAALRKVGIDPEKFAEQLVWEKIQREQREAEWAKDPAAKKRWEDEQELIARRAADEAAREAGLTQKQRDDQARFESGYAKKIEAALDLGKIPKTPEAVARMADELMIAVENGLDLSAEEIVAKVRDDYAGEISTICNGMDGDQLIQFLGAANLEKIRKADLARLKNPQGNPFPVRSQQKQAADRKDAPTQREARMSGSQWRESLAKDFLNRNK